MKKNDLCLHFSILKLLNLMTGNDTRAVLFNQDVKNT